MVTNYGEGVELQNGREGGGRASEVLPLTKWVTENVLAMLEGGGGHNML